MFKKVLFFTSMVLYINCKNYNSSHLDIYTKIHIIIRFIISVIDSYQDEQDSVFSAIYSHSDIQIGFGHVNELNKPMYLNRFSNGRAPGS